MPQGYIQAKRDGSVKTYGCDRVGNRLFSTGNGQETNYVYNELNQLLRMDAPDVSKEYEYDLRGNLTLVLEGTKAVSQFTFDSAGMLSSATTPKGRIEHTHNAMGRRISSATSSDMLDPASRIDYLLDLTKPYNDLLATVQDDMKQNYLWGMDAIGSTSTGVSQYYLHDHLGSPTRLLDDVGQTSAQYAFDEFGVPIIDPSAGIDSNSSSLRNPFGFTGYQHDGVTDLWFAQARYYKPDVGRFASEDTHWTAGNRISGDVGSSRPNVGAIMQSGNLYGYCVNNPIGRIDPKGDAAIWLTDVSGAWGFGHTSLLIQDVNGVWHHVNFGSRGSGLIQKGDVVINEVSPEMMAWITSSILAGRHDFSKDEIISNSKLPTGLERYFDQSGDTHLFIPGDFSEPLELARHYEAMQPKYFFTGQNCVWLSLEILAASYAEGTDIRNLLDALLWSESQNRKPIWPNFFDFLMMALLNKGKLDQRSECF